MDLHKKLVKPSRQDRSIEQGINKSGMRLAADPPVPLNPKDDAPHLQTLYIQYCRYTVNTLLVQIGPKAISISYTRDATPGDTNN